MKGGHEGELEGQAHVRQSEPQPRSGRHSCAGLLLRTTGRRLRADVAGRIHGDRPVSTALLTASAPTTEATPQRRNAALLIGFVIVGTLAAWMLSPLLMAPPWRMVGWDVRGFPGRVSDTAGTSMAIQVYVASWPTEYRQGDDSWLDQSVIETPWTVTIALHTSDAYDSGPALRLRSYYDTGGWVTVHLLMPLGGRMLFDGSGVPPQPRW